MRCKNLVTQVVPRGYGHRIIKTRCGSTGIYGNTLVCEECEDMNKKLYPQGWRETPGDVCVHGTYVGDQGGADYICGYCEEEDY